ncbi:translin family protein [Aspergillus candidus]|uniref:Translin family-domain-containing protein n=2 Tax=Aspergillus subgen. Circumdati TaxID=2720871 RepID=A0A2I2FAA4_ASPCN|nr:Translin family-domain-containing protein [Aspergillus candidus]PLB37556.1 Translin family-domain-containing protein [Aspergillus candidus]
MAGTKRSWEGTLLRDKDTQADTADVTMSDQSSQILSIFGTFRDELDEHHDRRERLTKISRDITALSKKIIFSLQRVRTLNAPLPPNITKETTSRFAQITELFKTALPDITAPLHKHRYARQISPGLQEFIEALSFHHYLETQTLITIDEVRARLLDGAVPVSEEDYLMGVFDLTGEMMRFAITSLSSGVIERSEAEAESNIMYPRLAAPQAGIVFDLREVRSLAEALSVPRKHGWMFRDLHKKVEVMQASVEKVERAAYGVLVRGSERPAGWMPDLSAEQVEVA